MVPKLPVPKCPSIAPPLNFAPGSATEEELKKYIYPPRPNPTSSPKQYAVWQQIASCRPQFVSSKISEFETTGLEESRNWSGAVLPSSTSNDDDDTPFDTVIGSWIIPNPHPGCYTWVGLDGWTNEDCFKIGVVLKLVVIDHKITERCTYGAMLFRGEAEDTMNVYVFEDFVVNPGDLVTGWAWVTGDDDCTTGNGWLCNQSSNQFVAASVDAPDDVVYEGTSAEWIVAGKNPDNDDDIVFPNYGATVFFNGLAHRKEGGIVSMKGAMMVNAQDIKSSAVRDVDGVIVHSATLF